MPLDRIVIVLTVVLAASCAAPAAQQASSSSGKPDAKAVSEYSELERARMGLCSALMDTAWGTAWDKKNGVPKAERLARYAGDEPVEKLARKMVEKVYADEFDRPWTYALGQFRECATELAKIPEDRVEFGAHCAQNVLVASIAYDQKKNGESREAVYKVFAGDSTIPRRIIDRVWASSATRGPAVMGEWDRCLDGRE